jgi:hypothetical protein
VIGSEYTLYNHAQDVCPYQTRRAILIIMVEKQHTAKLLKIQVQRNVCNYTLQKGLCLSEDPTGWLLLTSFSHCL